MSLTHPNLHGYGRRSLPDVFPVYALEEGEGLDVVVERPDARVGVAAQLEDGGLGRLGDGHLRRERQRVLPQHDLLVRVRRGLRAERRVTCTDKPSPMTSSIRK